MVALLFCKENGLLSVCVLNPGIGRQVFVLLVGPVLPGRAQQWDLSSFVKVMSYLQG